MTDKGLLEALSDDDTHFAGDLAGGSIGSCRRLSSTCRHDQKIFGLLCHSFTNIQSHCLDRNFYRSLKKESRLKDPQRRADCYSATEVGGLTKQSTMKPMEPMSGMKPMKPMEPMEAPVRWWPEELGEQPHSAGGQNEMRYAFFGDQQRLAVDTGDGKVQVYETEDHRISSVQQHESSGGRKITFTTPEGGSRFGDFETGLTNR